MLRIHRGPVRARPRSGGQCFERDPDPYGLDVLCRGALPLTVAQSRARKHERGGLRRRKPVRRGGVLRADRRGDCCTRQEASGLGGDRLPQQTPLRLFFVLCGQHRVVRVPVDRHQAIDQGSRQSADGDRDPDGTGCGRRAGDDAAQADICLVAGFIPLQQVLSRARPELPQRRDDDPDRGRNAEERPGPRMPDCGDLFRFEDLSEGALATRIQRHTSRRERYPRRHARLAAGYVGQPDVLCVSAGCRGHTGPQSIANHREAANPDLQSHRRRGLHVCGSRIDDGSYESGFRIPRA